MATTPEPSPRLTPSQRKVAAKARLEELVNQETAERHARELADPPVTEVTPDRWERQQLLEDRMRARRKWYRELGIAPPAASDPSKPRPAITPEWVPSVRRVVENLEREGKRQRWGFVVYRTAECGGSEWETAKEKIWQAAINGLEAPEDFSGLKDGAWLQWMDDSGLQTEGELDPLRACVLPLSKLRRC